MTEQEPMTIDERRKYLHKMRLRYWQAQSRSERSQLLDEMEQVTELHRKSLLRLIHGELARKPRRKQRGKSYGVEVQAVVRRIAHSLDFPCAERLQPNLVWMAEHLERHGELHLLSEIRVQLQRMSVSTLRRLLGPVEQQRERIAHRKRPPSPVGQLRKAVPMRRIAWDQSQPGHFEVDLVHHAGPQVEGLYAHTLQIVDVTTGWSECMPILGRSYLVMADGFNGILERMPFPVLELHPDNGAEFFNNFLIHFWKDKVKGVQLSRSRPYQKNDNRFVEENNFSLVRAYVGYARLDTVAHIHLLHKLYHQLWLYHNFFQPVMRLKQKLSPSEALRTIRSYDAARPPFDRLCETKVLPQERQRQLVALRDATNPCQVRRTIEQLTTQLFDLPTAREGVSEDVHQTLQLWSADTFSLPHKLAKRAA